MKQKLTAWIILLGVVFSLGAVYAQPIDAQMQKIADPIMDNILTAMKNNDYTAYCRDFDETMKNTVTPEKFRQSNENIKLGLGDYQSRDFGMVMKQAPYTIVIWKGHFSKRSGDVMIKLVLTQLNGIWKVSGLWFS